MPGEIAKREKRAQQLVKEEVRCENCPAIFIRRTYNHRLCKDCAPIEALERARQRINRISRERGAPQVGSMLNCGKCGAAFVLGKKGRQFYCEACRLPPRRDPSEPLPPRHCADCGILLSVKPGPGAKPVFCEDCGHRQKKHADLGRYYRRTGRETDLSAGVEAKCETCDNRIIKTRADSRFCDECLRLRLNAYMNQKRDAERRANGVPVRSGIALQCDNCGEEFIKQSNRHRFCRNCKNQPQIRGILRRIEDDPTFAFRHSFSAAIRKSLDRMKAGNAWEKLVGYTLTDLVRHLERQFTGKMSWENRGTYWELDHIRPLAQFNYSGADDQDFKDAWALTNLRPLRTEENRKKRAHRLFLI